MMNKPRTPKPKVVFGRAQTGAPRRKRSFVREPVYDGGFEDPNAFNNISWIKDQAGDSTPYYLQGDEDMETADALQARAALKKDKRVIKSINMFWKSFKKNNRMEVEKEQYVKFLVRVCKLVIPSFDEEDAKRTAESDWLRDSKGQRTLSYSAFFDAFFELADVWCPNINGREYAEFLDALRLRLQVMVITRRDGTQERRRGVVKEVTRREKKDLEKAAASTRATKRRRRRAKRIDSAASAGDNDIVDYVVFDRSGVKTTDRVGWAWADVAEIETDSKLAIEEEESDSEEDSEEESEDGSVDEVGSTDLQDGDGDGDDASRGAGDDEERKGQVSGSPRVEDDDSRPPTVDTSAGDSKADSPADSPADANLAAVEADARAAAAEAAAQRARRQAAEAKAAAEAEAKAARDAEAAAAARAAALAAEREAAVKASAEAKAAEATAAAEDDAAAQKAARARAEEAAAAAAEAKAAQQEQAQRTAAAELAAKLAAQHAAQLAAEAEAAARDAADAADAAGEAASRTPKSKKRGTPKSRGGVSPRAKGVSPRAKGVSPRAGKLGKKKRPKNLAQLQALKATGSLRSLVAPKTPAAPTDSLKERRRVSAGPLLVRGATPGVEAAAPPPPFDFGRVEPPARLEDFGDDPYQSDDEVAVHAHRSPTKLWVIGKPGVGKTTLCAKLAKALDIRHIGEQQVLEQAIREVRSLRNGDAFNDPTVHARLGLAKASVAFLERGETVPRALVYGLIRQAVADAVAVDDGYVLDGFPSSKQEYDSLKMELDDFNMKVKDVLPRHVINLDLSDDDTFLRLAGLRGDPITCTALSGDEIRAREEALAAAAASVGVDGEDDPLAQAGEVSLPKELPAVLVRFMPETENDVLGRHKESEGKASGGDEEGEGGAMSSRMLSARRKTEEQKPMTKAALASDPDRIIVNANQTAEAVFDEVMHRLAGGAPPKHRNPLPHAKARPLPLSDAVAGDTVVAQRRYLLYAPIAQEGMEYTEDLDADPAAAAGGDDDGAVVVPPGVDAGARNKDAKAAASRVNTRYWSSYRGMCPVVLKEEDRLQDGQLQFAAEYRRQVFLLSSKEALDKFVANPRKFIDQQPRLPRHTKVAIAGPARTGVTSMATRIAATLSVSLLDADAIITGGVADAAAAAAAAAADAQPPASQGEGGGEGDGQGEGEGEGEGKDEAQPSELEQGGVLPLPLMSRLLAQAVASCEGRKYEEPVEPAADGGADGEAGEGGESKGDNADGEGKGEGEGEGKAQGDGGDEGKTAEPSEQQQVGWVMDGAPVTAAQWQELLKRGVKPDTVVLLEPVDGWPPANDSASSTSPFLRSATVELGGSVDVDVPLAPSAAAFTAALNDLEAALREAGVDVRRVRVNGKLDEDLMFAAVHQSVDPFLMRADAPSEWNDAPTYVARQGDSAHYDPVEVRNGRLVPGKKEFEVRVKGESYYVSSEENLLKFQINPENYIKDTELAPPPPRLVLLAPRGSAANTHVQRLVLERNLQVRCPADVARADATISQKYADAIAAADSKEDPQPFPVDALVDACNTIFDDPEHAGSALLLSPFDELTPEVLAALIQGCCPPTLVVRLHTREVEVVGSRMAAEFSWSPPPPEPRPDDADDDWEAPPPPTAEELKELEDAATAAKREQLAAEYAADVERLAAVEESARAAGIHVLPLVDGTGNQQRVYLRLSHTLEPYLDGEWDPFTTAFRVTPALADHLLATTAYRVSKFRRHCPVTYAHTNELVDVPSYPVVYRRHVYFCASKEAADRLVATPEPYIRGPPAPPCLAGSCAVLGPPCSGVNSCARAIAQQYGRVLITPTRAVQGVLEGPDSVLRRRVMDAMQRGEDIQNELLAKCVGQAVHSKAAQTKGWVLVQFPLTAKHNECMAIEDVVPDLILYMRVSDATILERATARYESDIAAGAPVAPSHDPEWVAGELDEFHHEFPAVSAYYLKHYENLRLVDASHSKWHVTDAVGKIVKKAAARARTHAQAIDIDHAGCILDVCIKDTELLRRQGFMQDYCPVSWATKRELVKVGGCARRRYGAEYRGKFYHCAGPRELELFLAQPTRYLARQRLPSHLPSRIPFGQQTSATVALGGYCPVSMYETPGWDGLQLGHATTMVKYRGRVYLFSNERCLAKFMRTPDRFAMQELPTKLPPAGRRVSASALATMNLESSVGYLEQSVSNLLIRALTSLDGLKDTLKHPRLSVSQTALMYVALYFKAWNPASSTRVRQRQGERLKDFVAECKLFDAIRCSTPRGSGVAAVRNARTRSEQCGMFDALLKEPMASIWARHTAVPDGPAVPQ